MNRVVFLLFLIVFNRSTFAASSTARCFQQVLQQISIQKISDLDFGIAVQGDPEKTVSADTIDNGSNASFEVLGEKNKSFQIVLPPNNTVWMTKTTEPVFNQKAPLLMSIPVNNFTTNSQTDSLDQTGRKLIFVGASRGQILSYLPIGTYEGEFIVDVVY